MTEFFKDLTSAERMQYINDEGQKLIALAIKMGVCLSIDMSDAPFDENGKRHCVQFTAIYGGEQGHPPTRASQSS